jgi:C-terminal processing protease CtpA/Prc
LVATKDGIVAASNGPREAPPAGERLVRIANEPASEGLRHLCEQPGSTVAQRTRQAVATLLHRVSFDGAAPPSLDLVFAGRDGQEHGFTLRYRPDDERAPAPAPCVVGTVTDRQRSVGYLRVRTFWCGGDTGKFQTELGRAVDAIGSVAHLIVDLRDNDGGMDRPAKELARLLIKERAEWMRFRHPRPYAEASDGKFFREYIEPSEQASPWRKSKLSILVGPGCFSTCETFASAFRAIPDVAFFGEPTAGGVGNPTPFRLPYSGLTVNIPVSLYAFPGRAEDILIEGRGIEPDHVVVTSIDDVTEQRDPVLAAAVAAGK